MSAYMVSPTHIDALLTAGLTWVRYGPLRWFDGTEPPPDDAYQPGAPWGPGAAKWIREHSRELTRETAGRVGAMLLAENRRSVDHRYAEEEWEEPYVFNPLRGNPDPLVVLCALRCYEYQSSEHPDWPKSEAYRFCEALKTAAIREATMDIDVWEITDRNVFQLHELRRGLEGRGLEQ
jgi:hypothetical protein